MELKKLKTASLSDALIGMKVGESAIAPDGYARRSVTKMCCDLKKQGYIFTTTTKTGEQVITRIQ